MNRVELTLDVPIHDEVEDIERILKPVEVSGETRNGEGIIVGR